ncbi:MAG: ribonuclease R [Patescibacteria group bacterium]
MQKPRRTPNRVKGNPEYRPARDERAALSNPKKTYQGIIFVNAKGVGYVEIPDSEEDIEIENQHMNTSLHKDTVEILLLPLIRGRQAGKVLKIVTRIRTRFVCTIAKDGDTPIAVPDERKFYTQIELPKNTLLPVGRKALVEMTWNNPLFRPTGVILEDLGQKGDNDVEMRSILLEKGFGSSFPEAVEAEAADIKRNSAADFAEEIPKRRDFRGTPTMTIDPKDAKDFDDALSVKELPDGNLEIGVHIADVSHYVRPGTKLDEEAGRRATSVYLVDRTFPMLPETLSNDLCSLNPNENKLAFSVTFTLSKEGDILNKIIGRSIIRSDKRFTYENAQEVLDKGQGTFHKELETLRRLAKKFEKARFGKGAIAFEEDEVKFELDEKGKPVRVFRKKRLDTHRLVEEWMLLANTAAAEFVEKLATSKNSAPPFIYRIHDTPDRDRIAALAIFLKAIGRHLTVTNGKVTGKDINALFKQLEGEAEEGIVKTAALRSMTKAIYSTKNIGHFGLHFEAYTHFTSPIRRYPDTIVHRLLATYLSGKKVPAQDISFYEKIGRHSTEAEIRATEAERESIKMKQVEWMKERVGQEFDGIVSGVTEWGIYLEEKETKSEGMVRLRDLTDDYYILDEKNYRLVGEKTKKTYSLGDKVRFRVTAADPERKTLDYKLL